jgi:hypothetical protein
MAIVRPLDGPLAARAPLAADLRAAIGVLRASRPCRGVALGGMSGGWLD